MRLAPLTATKCNWRTSSRPCEKAIGVSMDGAAAQFQQLGTLFFSVYFWQKMHQAVEGRSCQTGAFLGREWEPKLHARLSKATACDATSGGDWWVVVSSGILLCVWYLRIAVVDKDVSCAVVFQVGDLQAAGVADLSRLEGGIEGLNLHHRFGVSGLHGGWREILLSKCL